MATTKTKPTKGKAEKPAKGAKAPKDDLAELEADIGAALDEGFDLAEVSEEPAEKPKGKAPAAKPAKGKKAPPAVPDMVGKTVRFAVSETEEATGKVVEQDGTTLKIEGEDLMYQADVEDVDVVDEGTEGGAEDEADVAESGSESSDTGEAGEESGGADDEAGEPAEEEAVTTATATKTKAAKGKKAETQEAEAQERDPRIREVRILVIDEIKIPADKPREFVEDEEFARFVADIKDAGLRDEIEVSDFDKPILIEGLRRINAYRKLGRTEIPAVVPMKKLEDKDDRLWEGLMANQHRKPMSWIELAKAWAKLVKGGRYTQRKIAKAYGVSDAEVSRAIAALKLPKPILEIAAEKSDTYSPTVFQELAQAPEKVQAEALAAMKADKGVTVADVRALRKEVAQEEKAAAKASGKAAEEKPAAPAKKKAAEPASSYTYRDLSSEDTGDKIRLRVHRDHLEIRLRLDWTNKTFKNLELVKAIKGIFDENFQDPETRVKSFAELEKALTAAKSELA